MKANLKSAATSLIWGMVATTGIVLTACSDELENTGYSNNEAATTVQKDNAATGTYQTVYTDPETGLYMNLILNDSIATIKSFNSSGEQGSATVNLENAGSSNLGSATLSSTVGDIKSFTLRKVGAFYLECKATMSDGTEKEIGFVSQSLKVGSTASETAVSTAKIGLKLLICQCTWLMPVAGDLISLIPGLSDSSTDMSVSDCFTQLSSQISALDQKINNLAYEIKTYHDDDQIDEHRKEYNAVQINNSTYFNKLASIAAAMETASSDSTSYYEQLFDECVEEWAKASTTNGAGYSAAIQYLLNTENGSSDHKVWCKVFDSCAERLFPWEHQAYDTRQAFRDRDLILNMESIALLTFYKQTEEGKSVDLTNAQAAYQAISDSYDAEDNQVVKDNDHAICQIKGADHVMIDKTVFSTYENPYPTPIGYKVTADFTNFGVPGNRYTNADLYANTALLTVDEAEAIVDYYGGKYTFREILENECGMTCANEEATDQTVVMPLWKSSVSLSCIKKSWPKRWYTFTANKAIYLDNKESTIQSFVLGTYIAYVGDSVWDLVTNSDYEFTNTDPVTKCQCIVKVLKIDGRTDGWTPGEN